MNTMLALPAPRSVSDIGNAVTSADALALAVAVIAVHIALWLLLRSSIGLVKIIRESGVTLIARVSGLLVSAIAVQMIADAVRAFAPITVAATNYLIMAVPPSIPARSVRELVQLAKAKPGQISFAYASTSQQVSSEMLASMGGIKMNPVPYKSGPAAMTDLIGGQVNMFTADFAVMVPQVKGGKVRGLAVTSTKRSSVVPDLPTVNEALGLKDYELIAYFAIFAPAGTPPEAIARLNKAINNAANAKDVQEKLSSFGLVIDPGTPEDLAKRNQAESIKWSKAIRDAKIEPQ